MARNKEAVGGILQHSNNPFRTTELKGGIGTSSLPLSTQYPRMYGIAQHSVPERKRKPHAKKEDRRMAATAQGIGAGTVAGLATLQFTKDLKESVAAFIVSGLVTRTLALPREASVFTGITSRAKDTRHAARVALAKKHTNNSQA